MTDDESRPDEEYEPEEIDPDNPVETTPADGTPPPPPDADRADWLDQHREVPLDDDDERDGG